eukprot:6667456-Alexandrium_andersonii.AAC.1
MAAVQQLNSAELQVSKCLGRPRSSANHEVDLERSRRRAGADRLGTNARLHIVFATPPRARWR